MHRGARRPQWQKASLESCYLGDNASLIICIISLLTMWFLTMKRNNHTKIAYDFRSFWDILCFWNIVFQNQLRREKVPQLSNVFKTSGLKNVPKKNNTADRSVRLAKNNTDVLDYSAQSHIYYSCSTTAKCHTKKNKNKQ